MATRHRLSCGICWSLLAALIWGTAVHAADDALVLERAGRVISLTPYAPNVLRVSMSIHKDDAFAKPGYGIHATPSGAGWKHQKDANGAEVFSSDRLIVRVANEEAPRPLPLDEANSQLRSVYFGGEESGRHADALVVTTEKGVPLLRMRNWTMIPERSASSAGEMTYRISAVFDSPAQEHFYGLGQQQQGWMDLRNHEIRCWHDYGAIGGEAVCVPFVVSTLGYGLIWDNPSKTTVDLGFNERSSFSSEVGRRVSFFVIAGERSDEIYSGYRLLTGAAHLLPRAAYGFIQSKAIYPTQEQILEVADRYREKNLPLDVLVVDFLNMTRQGELDLDPKRWPDPAAMNRRLHGQGVDTLLSVWPHFSPATQFYQMLEQKHWLIQGRDGKPDMGWAKPVIGPNIDTTNPEAAKWWWEKIRDRYIKPYGFDYLWLDETEPDFDPANDMFFVGPGKDFYNVYPLFHTASVYEGFRRDFGDSRRVMILARASYLGAQSNGTVFWSSDVYATWDMLKRSIPAGLNFTASGMPYWDTDIGGFFSPALSPDYHAAHKPLIDGSDVGDTIDRYEDYPELFVRWFEWGAFHPVMRTHGERKHNEIWSYGRQAEPILTKYLKLRYQLLPYTYSIAYQSYKTGAPFMRALFMDFPRDAQALNVPDEYMYGPAFLVAPVTEQGATERSVYLPAGSDWYNYWTNERLHGGQTISAKAPIDTLPLFVKAGSIVPLGSEVLSAKERQSIAAVKIYPGANAAFDVFQDDGSSYAYEKGQGSLTTLSWDDGARRLKHEGPPLWSGSDRNIVTVVENDRR